MDANVYLTFNGNCKEAFDFYQKVFNAEVLHSSTFAEMPTQEGQPPLPDDMKDKIMHITITIGDAVLMGSDTGGEWGAKFKQGNNFSVSINADSKEQADQLFESLSEGGVVTMPIDKTFWGSYFGSCEDQFGVNWMVSFGDQ